jgi:hypothetical protein
MVFNNAQPCILTSNSRSETQGEIKSTNGYRRKKGRPSLTDRRRYLKFQLCGLYVTESELIRSTGLHRTHP